MKIAVYTIALNEEQFVQRWYDSAKEADYLLIADTGSTDNTARAAQRLGINVVSISVKPWRFDDARNAALALLPDDIDMCISLDMDELLVKGWRKKLEAVSSSTTRPRYTYTWNFIDDKPGLQFGGDHIHARHNYRWKHPVHEVLVADRITEIQEWTDIEIHHKADPTKSRGQYLPLLALSVKEDPNDVRNAFYYARELYFYNRYEEATAEFKRYLALPGAIWPPERAAAYRFMAKTDSENALEHLLNSLNEDPSRREASVELANYFYKLEDWGQTLLYASQAVAIIDKPLDYLCEDFAWGSLPWDLLSLAAYYTGDVERAVAALTKALEYEPSNERLLRNMVYFTRN
jgi:glycosyltransferase involved in cell wall biosynthesis